MFHERARIVEPEQRIEIWRVCEEFPLARPPFTGATIVRFHRPFSCGRLHNAWHWHLSRYTRLPSLSFLISSLPHAARPLASAPGATLYGVIKFFLHRTFAKSASARSIVSSETPGTSCDTHREREREREEKGTGNCIGRPIVWPPYDHPCVSPILHRYYCKLQLHRLFEKRSSRLGLRTRNFVRSLSEL